MEENDSLNSPHKPRDLRYANYFEVGFNADEIILDCGQYHPGDARPIIHTRLITTPAYAQALMDLLRESLARRKRENDLGTQ